jgi:hypothetical protein
MALSRNETAMLATPPRQQPDPLGWYINALTPEVEADRQRDIRNGPTEQIRDALAIVWLRRKLYRDTYGVYDNDKED